jgi:protein SCO1/2
MSIWLSKIRRCPPLARLLLAAWFVAAGASGVGAQVVEGQPGELEGVGVDEKLDASIPLDLAFVDSTGQSIRLQEIFAGQRPVLLSLNYSDCPMLCRVQLNGLVDALKEMTWTPGREFDVVSVSIDPAESVERSAETKAKYLKMYGRPVPAAGWRFLTGSQEAINQLADAVGFRFRYVPDRKEYSHAAVLMVCTPPGRVSRYLYGIAYDPQTLKLSLVEAGEGKIGSSLDRVLLFCFHYDPDARRYGMAARRVMQLGGGLTVLVLLCILLPAWIRRRPRPAGTAAASATAEPGGSRETCGADIPVCQDSKQSV